MCQATASIPPTSTLLNKFTGKYVGVSTGSVLKASYDGIFAAPLSFNYLPGGGSISTGGKFASSTLNNPVVADRNSASAWENFMLKAVGNGYYTILHRDSKT